jgi:hypothetical protein
MAIGPISASTVPGAYDGARAAGESKTEGAAAEQPTIADHVAAADEHEPVRSFSSTRGTLVDTYL